MEVVMTSFASSGQGQSENENKIPEQYFQQQNRLKIERGECVAIQRRLAGWLAGVYIGTTAPSSWLWGHLYRPKPCLSYPYWLLSYHFNDKILINSSTGITGLNGLISLLSAAGAFRLIIFDDSLQSQINNLISAFDSASMDLFLPFLTFQQ